MIRADGSRKRITAVALMAVGLATGTAYADEPVEHVAPAPALYSVALPVVASEVTR